jgi:hypothetical protein
MVTLVRRGAACAADVVRLVLLIVPAPVRPRWRLRLAKRAEMSQIEIKGRAIVIALREHSISGERIERLEMLRQRPELD